MPTVVENPLRNVSFDEKYGQKSTLLASTVVEIPLEKLEKYGQKPTVSAPTVVEICLISAIFTTLNLDFWQNSQLQTLIFGKMYNFNFKFWPVTEIEVMWLFSQKPWET